MGAPWDRFLPLCRYARPGDDALQPDFPPSGCTLRLMLCGNLAAAFSVVLPSRSDVARRVQGRQCLIWEIASRRAGMMGNSAAKLIVQQARRPHPHAIAVGAASNRT